MLRSRKPAGWAPKMPVLAVRSHFIATQAIYCQMAHAVRPEKASQTGVRLKRQLHGDKMAFMIATFVYYHWVNSYVVYVDG